MTTRKQYKQFTAKIMADSKVVVGNQSHRLISFEVEFPRIVLAEFNTHRLLSRNSASSRAIPAKKMLEIVDKSPFIPDRFPRDHKGMQASEWIYPEDEQYSIWENFWLSTKDAAVRLSQSLSNLGMSKQLTNRILEPFLMHRVIVTGTEWENFFALRAASPAQNEIRIIAELMLEAANESKPRRLEAGQWHMPYGDLLDESLLAENLSDEFPSIELLMMAVTVARCARVSYLNFEGKDDYEADLKLYRQLKESGHMSPFEHVARAMSEEEYFIYSHSQPGSIEYGWCGNFRGFIQARKFFPSEVENRTDPRLLLK